MSVLTEVPEELVLFVLLELVEEDEPATADIAQERPLKESSLTYEPAIW